LICGEIYGESKIFKTFSVMYVFYSILKHEKKLFKYVH